MESTQDGEWRESLQLGSRGQTFLTCRRKMCLLMWCMVSWLQFACIISYRDELYLNSCHYFQCCGDLLDFETCSDETLGHLPQEPLSLEELHQVHLGSLDIIHCFSHDIFQYCPSGVMIVNNYPKSQD